MSGLIVPEARWFTLKNKLHGLKVASNYYGEIKWRYFAPSNTDIDNPMREWNQAQRDLLRQRIFEILTTQKSIKIICCVSDAKAAYQLGNVNCASDIYFQTYKPITERFQYFLQDINRESGLDAFGIVVADHRGRGDDAQLRLQHERLVNSDRKYTSTYLNLMETLFFTPSHLSVGIQLVDMVAGAVWRRFEHNDRRWFDIIRPMFRSDRTGAINGYGLVRFPKGNWAGPIEQ